jgi:hypothetical protein
MNSTFARSWNEIQQLIIFGLTEYMVQITETFTLRAWQPNLKIYSHWYISTCQHETLFVELYSYRTYCVSEHQCLVPGHLGSDDILMWILTMIFTIFIVCCSLELLCAQFQPIAFPEFPFECIKIVCIWIVYSSTIYKIPLRKSPYFSDRWKLAIGRDRISAKIGFKFACDQLTFWNFTVQSSKFKKVRTTVK